MLLINWAADVHAAFASASASASAAAGADAGAGAGADTCFLSTSLPFFLSAHAATRNIGFCWTSLSSKAISLAVGRAPLNFSIAFL